MGQFRKKPVVVDAIQFAHSNFDEVTDFCWPAAVAFGHKVNGPAVIAIQTFSGAMPVNDGDWIIRPVPGHVYPCKPDIFAATYEAVE